VLGQLENPPGCGSAQKRNLASNFHIRSEVEKGGRGHFQPIGLFPNPNFDPTFIKKFKKKKKKFSIYLINHNLILSGLMY